jgi:3-dehydroquinate dehydratase/shikimate dehydrogenase
MAFVATPIRVARADAVSSALEDARRVIADGARMIEWRVDELIGPGDLAATERLVRDSPAPCIVTCRGAVEGGGYVGPDDARWAYWEGVARFPTPPRYIDVEWSAARTAPARLASLSAVVSSRGSDGDSPTGLILSSHDFEGRPADLLQQIEAMSAEPGCAVIKVAWRARSLRDNLEAFELLSTRPRPMIALCMGEFGLPSRVLAPKFGGLVTFAAADPRQATAPGQPTVRDLRDVYRIDRVSATTLVYGVIGWPIAHSRGPHLHNAGFEAVGHDGVYLPLPVPADPLHFKATVTTLLEDPRLQFAGASVTLPHKENLVQLVRERGGVIEPLAALMGAGNTLAVDPGGLRCANTDGPAAVEALCDAMAVAPDGLTGRRVAVLGAGGVARAVVAALALAGAEIVVFNRDRARAEALAAALAGKPRPDGGTTAVTVGESAALAGGGFEVVINCTPIGMDGGPAPDRSPLDALGGETMPLNDRVAVFDTVYTPRRTPLIREAEARGARTVTGDEMFVRQAALQLEMWTGAPAPMELYRRRLAEAEGIHHRGTEDTEAG